MTAEFELEPPTPGAPSDVIPPVTSGARYGKLTAIDRATGHSMWLCRCDCGRHTTAFSSNLRYGNTKSCGCFRKELGPSILRNKHALRRNPLYLIWRKMLSRCENPKDIGYARYGGRGIRVCEHWHTFENFAADMGERSAGMSIDRIDNDGNYQPGNVRWATDAEQANNRANSRRIVFAGLDLTVAEWARKYGLTKATLLGRINRGWSMEKALGLDKLDDAREEAEDLERLIEGAEA